MQQNKEKSVLDMTEEEARVLQFSDKYALRPSFPVYSFPALASNFINEYSKYSNIPVEFLGTSILAAASAAIGNTHRIKIKQGWTEGASLYLMLVGEPGTSKTPALQFALKPIYERQKLFNDIYYEDLEKWKQDCKEIEKGEDVPDPPKLQQLLLSDATTEAISEVLRRNERGVLIYRDEGIALIKSANQYRSGADLEYYLSLFNNQPITINRKSRDEPISINQPYASFIGGIQPSVMPDLLAGNRDQNGFIDRVLFAWTDHKPGHWTDMTIEDKVFSGYDTFINNLLTISSKELLEFNKSGNDIFIEFYNQNIDKLNSTDSYSKKSWYAKIPMHVARLSLIIELMNWAADPVRGKEYISAESVESAINLAEYFTYTAFKIRNDSKPDPNPNAVKAAEMIRQKVPQKSIALQLGVSESMITKYKKKHPELFE